MGVFVDRAPVWRVQRFFAIVGFAAGGPRSELFSVRGAARMAVKLSATSRGSFESGGGQVNQEERIGGGLSDWADHREIGTGIIDFPRLFASVRRINFAGLYVLELEGPDTIGALERSRAYVETLIAYDRAPFRPGRAAASPYL